MSQVEVSKKIYSQLQFVIDELVDKLSSDSRDKTTHETTQLARDLLTKLHKQIQEELTILDKYSEWDTYTIAFYGETNAGKSTIIETLRILLGEEGKKKQQSEFNEWQKSNGVTKETVKAIRKLILDAESDLEQQQSSFRQLSAELDLVISSRESYLNTTKMHWDQLKKSASFLQRILWLFQTVPESKAYKDAQKSLAQAKSDIKKKTKEFADRIDAININISKSRAEYEKMLERVAQIEPFADGAIIGNGRSDFTLETQSYTFERDGHRFNLLDVPGIEGKESKVSDAIWQAVHKAHTVFYVTGKASAPQKGDGKNPGTLDKIKQHLGAQSEVWTVFNKRVQNPIQINGRDLVSSGEEQSLQVLDKTMRDYLGDSYQSHLSVSAYPAFLAASSCLIPGSRDETSQEKFFVQFTEEELLKKSNIHAITEMFNEKTVSTFKEKIFRSNNNKAREVVNRALNGVSELSDKHFKPLLKSLEQELDNTSHEVNSHVKTLRSRLYNQVSKELRKFADKVREETYDEIDSDISNDRFKRVLENSVRNNQKELIDIMPSLVNQEIINFEKQINETLDRFQEQTNDVMHSHNSFNNIDSSISINIDNIDNGINVWGVLGAVGGGVALIFTPIGWGLIAVSAASLVFQAYKAIRSFFSSGYKQSQ
ncbi:AAA family ATPase, partial [Vibrio cholerae]|nr:AAA family ATPase [Vibrio cholerae]